MKRGISVFLCLVLILGLFTGCSGDEVKNTMDVAFKTLEETTDSLTQGIKDKLNAEQNEALAQVRAQADERRRAILDSPTEIVRSDSFVKGETYTGTAYYVSNNGSDYNSGRSPESAFATVAPFEYISLYPGDAVFFERGSVWRGMELPWNLHGTEGLTFSAYGEGPKPAFYGSFENGTGAEKWELYYEDAEGKKIWKYYTDMTELGSIVLNGSEIVRRDIPWWDGSVYQEMNMPHQDIIGEEYDVTKHLPDMWCFPALDYTEPMPGVEMNDIYSGWDYNGWVYRVAPLYLRCDAGNPGEIYEDIEFIQPITLCSDASSGQVFDNLSIMYSHRGIMADPEDEGVLIQNCEFGWIGGCVYDYASDQERKEMMSYSGSPIHRDGHALELNSNDTLVEDNYFHHIFYKAVSSYLYAGQSSIENNIIRSNLIECSGRSITLTNDDTAPQPDRLFKNILIEDNIVLDSGEDYFLDSKEERSHNSMAFQLEGGMCPNENLVVRNNIFALSKGMLIAIYTYSEQYSKVFDGNTYIHTEGDNPVFIAHGLWRMDEESDLGHMELDKETIEYYLGDYNSKSYIIRK